MENILSQLSQTQKAFEAGTVVQFLIMITISHGFGLALNYCYLFYFRRNEPVDGSLSRSFGLIAPGVTAIFWLIQYSLPLSLGLLGALSFVRFRTPVKRAEDIAFILVTIAGALACAVARFPMALTLLGLVAVYSFFRNRYPKLLGERTDFAVVTFNTSQVVSPADILTQLEKHGARAQIASHSTYDKVTSLVLNVPHVTATKCREMLGVLRSVDPTARIDFFYPEHQVGG